MLIFNDLLAKLELIQRISKARAKANLSARELSNRIGKNDGYINRLECTKDFLPSMDIMFKIIEACGMTEEEFFYHDPNEYKVDMQLIKDFKDIPKEKKEAILVLMKK